MKMALRVLPPNTGAPEASTSTQHPSDLAQQRAALAVLPAVAAACMTTGALSASDAKQLLFDRLGVAASEGGDGRVGAAALRAWAALGVVLLQQQDVLQDEVRYVQ